MKKRSRSLEKTNDSGTSISSTNSVNQIFLRDFLSNPFLRCSRGNTDLTLKDDHHSVGTLREPPHKKCAVDSQCSSHSTQVHVAKCIDGGEAIKVLKESIFYASPDKKSDPKSSHSSFKSVAGRPSQKSWASMFSFNWPFSKEVEASGSLGNTPTYGSYEDIIGDEIQEETQTPDMSSCASPYHSQECIPSHVEQSPIYSCIHRAVSPVYVGGLPASQEDEPLSEGLADDQEMLENFHNHFLDYVNGGKQHYFYDINLKLSEQWFKQALIIDGIYLTCGQANKLFQNCLPPKKFSMNFAEYKNYVSMLCQLCFLDETRVCKKLIECPVSEESLDSE